MHPLKIQPEHQYIPSVLQNGKILSQCLFCHFCCDFPKVKAWDKLAQDGVGGQHPQAGVMLEQTDCCSVLACGSSLTCSLFSQTETVLKPLWLLPTAVLETGAQGSCNVQILLHPTLPSSRLSGYECSFSGHRPVCVYVVIHLFMCIREKTTQKPALAHAAHALEKSWLHLFACAFHYAAKVVLVRLR